MMCPFLIKYKYPTHVDLHLREHVKKIASLADASANGGGGSTPHPPLKNASFFSKFYETKEYANIVCDIFARESVKNFKIHS